MRKFAALIALGFVGVFSLTLVAADPPPADYQAAMKALGAAMAAIAKGAQATEMDYDALIKSAKSMHDPFKVTETFWDLKKSSAPVGWARAGNKNAFDLETAASLGSDEGVQFALKELGGQCAACHEKHREKGADGGWLIKY